MDGKIESGMRRGGVDDRSGPNAAADGMKDVMRGLKDIFRGLGMILAALCMGVVLLLKVVWGSSRPSGISLTRFCSSMRSSPLRSARRTRDFAAHIRLVARTDYRLPASFNMMSGWQDEQGRKLTRSCHLPRGGVWYHVRVL